MPTPNASQACPDVRLYRQMTSGLLTDADRESLLRHLEGCDRCAGELSKQPNQDTLAELLRQARTSSEGLPREAVARLVDGLKRLRPSSAPAAPASPRPAAVFACPACRKGMKVAGEMAGQKVRCPYCRQVVAIPAMAPEGATAAFHPRETMKGSGETVDLPPAAGADKQYTDFLTPPQAPDELGRLGSYRVLRVLGSGGMGVVFRAEDPQLLRPVALKAMLPPLAASEGARQRFLREARAAAAIRHDHIVAVYQVGEDRGVPFLTMEFLEGEPLDARLERQSQLPPAEAVRIGREMALGLAAAHKRGLVHRDIKPANVWLEAETGRVKILDFGLARGASEGGQITQLGAVVGTPGYMAPEQAQGKAIDARCDLFALGCVLYRMTTGRSAFHGTDLVSTIVAVCTHQPPPPHKLDATVPLALSKLIVQLLAKEPEGRPPSAQAVAEILERLTHEPVSPAPAARPRRRRKWPRIAGAVACVVLLGLGAAGVFRLKTKDGTIVVENLSVDAEVFVDGEKVAVHRKGDDRPIEIQVAPGKRKLEIKAGGFKMETREVMLASGERRPIGIRLEPLSEASEKPAPQTEAPAPAKELLAFQRDKVRPEALAFAGDGDPNKAPASLVGVLGEVHPYHAGAVFGLAYSPDGRWLASGSADKTILLREAASGGVKRILTGHTGAVSAVAFSKDSKTLASSGRDGALKLWPMDREADPKTVEPGIGEIGAMAVSPDGRFLAAGGAERTFKLWRWGQWDKPLDLAALDARVTSLSFSQDGESLAASWDGRVRFYQTADGKATQTWPRDESNRVVAFHPDGKWLATAGGFLQLWEVHSGKLLKKQPGSGAWNTLAIQPDGKVLYGSEIGGIGGWRLDLTNLNPAKATLNLAPGKQFREPHGLLVAAYSPDGHLLAFGTDNGGVHVWDFSKGEKQLPKNGHSHYVHTLSVSPDGRTVLTGGDDNAVRRWDVARPRESKLLYKSEQGLYFVAYSPDGKKYTTSARFWYDTAERGFVWDATEGKRPFVLDPPEEGEVGETFSPDGKVIAGFSRGFVVLWDATNGKEVHQFPKMGWLAARPTFSSDGKFLAAASNDPKALKVWNVADGGQVQSLQDDAPLCALALGPDGRFLAAGRDDGIISLWDVSAKPPKKRTLGGHSARINVLRFTPDGRTLVSSANDGTIRLWDPERQRSLREVILLGPAKGRLVFDLDPSGKYLFAGGQSPAIFILRLPEGDNRPASDGGMQPKGKKAPAAAAPRESADDAWCKQVAALSTAKQRDAVVARLKELNPDFDGNVEYKVEGGAITEFRLSADLIEDISPVRALVGLRKLDCIGSDRKKGQLADLSPLKHLKLTSLNCRFTQVADLAPLKGMPLTDLNCSGTLVADLYPLKDMPLTDLHCAGTPVADLSPLRGMKLTTLEVGETLVSDLSPLKGMPLTFLGIKETRVLDLSPLKGLPLTFLQVAQTNVSDLSPLKDMKLEILMCYATRVTDLSPVKEMPLKWIVCDFVPDRDAKLLRSIKTLERINDRSAAEFWKALDEKK